MSRSDAYDAWQRDCLAEWNKRNGDNRTSFDWTGEQDPVDVVEFGENGSAYPHGTGGTGFVRSAVTPWQNSPHYASVPSTEIRDDSKTNFATMMPAEAGDRCEPCGRAKIFSGGTWHCPKCGV